MNTWPTKQGPLSEAGILGQYGEQDSIPDCDRCTLYSRGCGGYTPLTPDTALPPCRTYTDYSEYALANPSLYVGGINET